MIIRLPPGVHIYKFLVDGEWKFSPDDQTVADENGNINNIIDTSQYTSPAPPPASSKRPEGKLKATKQPVTPDSKQQKAVKIPGEKEWAHQAPVLPTAYQSVPFIEFKELKTRMFNEKQYLNTNLQRQLDTFDESDRL